MTRATQPYAAPVSNLCFCICRRSTFSFACSIAWEQIGERFRDSRTIPDVCGGVGQVV